MQKLVKMYLICEKSCRKTCCTHSKHYIIMVRLLLKTKYRYKFKKLKKIKIDVQFYKTRINKAKFIVCSFQNKLLWLSLKL